MTPDTLAAIVARDAAWTGWDEPGGPFLEQVTQNEDWDETLADRHALLALLRETRDALRELPVYEQRGGPHAGGYLKADDVLACLAALDTEVPA